MDGAMLSTYDIRARTRAMCAFMAWLHGSFQGSITVNIFEVRAWLG
jgi:hypothetical protein